MTDWTGAVIAALDRLPGPPWDVLPGLDTPPQSVCGRYACAGAAHAALIGAGFDLTARFVAAPPLAPTYDPRSVLRYGTEDGRDVLLVRRTAEDHGCQPAACRLTIQPTSAPRPSVEGICCIPRI